MVHGDQDLVKEYIRLRESGDKKMFEIVGQLRRKGNAEYNKLLKEKGLPVEGVKTAKDDSQSLLKSCPNCGAFYKKRTLHRHFNPVLEGQQKRTLLLLLKEKRK